MLSLSILALLSTASALGLEHPLTLSQRASDVPDIEHWKEVAESQGRELCYLTPDPDGEDDAPAIEDALNNKCRSNSLVVFPGPVYNIETTMTTTELDDVIIEHYGRLLWTPDVDYWLTVSMPIGFQNQSTVWFFGGDNIHWDGHGVGTLDGNGQVWYDWAEGRGNLPHRPMNINYRGFNNSVVKRMRYVQSQMWTMTVSYSENVEFEDIYVNSTSNSSHSTLNTDGVDTMWSDNIAFRRWSVTNGDDCIALKGNSSNIYIDGLECWDGAGIAIGSLAQYDGRFEHIENFFVRDVTVHNTVHAVYLKTWSGNPNGYPPNGGGGGLGYARNIVVQNLTMDLVRQKPFFLWQCENYSGDSGKDCNSSTFHFSDIVWKDITGTMASDINASGWYQCSLAAGGCNNITVENYTARRDGEDDVFDVWHCENVHEHEGFECNL
ncbi:hypothetical protein QQX98_009515 [Neonectria punicea]|uniref:Uncharacterized protein n=1 Tax=Neonectria punicea TaxID=979145 RepID=A0ABR1GS63_9HYPO